MHQQQMRVAEQRFSQTGVYRAQHHLLMYLSFHPDSSQKEIAEEFRISPSAVGVSLKKLEQAGYIERVVNEEDNRCNRVRLTGQGCQIVMDSKQIFDNLLQETYQGLTEQEMEQMYRILTKICGNLETMARKEEMKR